MYVPNYARISFVCIKNKKERKEEKNNKQAIQVYCSIVRLNIFRIISIFVMPVILKGRDSTFHMIYFSFRFEVSHVRHRKTDSQG